MENTIYANATHGSFKKMGRTNKLPSMINSPKMGTMDHHPSVLEPFSRNSLGLQKKT